MASRFSAIPTIALYDNRLSTRNFMTLAVLASFSDEDGWCYPSGNTMAEISGISRQAIGKSINHLISCGYVEKKDRYRSDGSQSSNIYRVLYDYRPGEKHLRGKHVEGHYFQQIIPEITPDYHASSMMKVEIRKARSA